ncbi:MAG: hypothetical protein IJ343_05310 [Clostridia bacterium]|nr:hypothetical protein [Clostridia bacterium]
MRVQRSRKRVRPGRGRRDTAQICLLGIILIAAGMVLLFLCIPGWAWAALIGAALVMAGWWLISFGRC